MYRDCLMIVQMGPNMCQRQNKINVNTCLRLAVFVASTVKPEWRYVTQQDAYDEAVLTGLSVLLEVSELADIAPQAAACIF
jgi:hypothetical protein